SVLRPTCLAVERLRTWRPVGSAPPDNPTLPPQNMSRVTEVLGFAWQENTLRTYGAGLAVFHLVCDVKGIPEHCRAPASSELVIFFLATLAGSYAESTLHNYLAGLHAWHIIHLLPWELQNTTANKILAAARNLAPAASRKPPRPPY
ncbi:hypothetical protein FA95DRAFT_1495980, partial [Auriscalpium vulgare]